MSLADMVSPQVRAVVDAVEVGPDGTSAALAGTALPVGSPRETVRILGTALYHWAHAGLGVPDGAARRRRSVRDEAMEEALFAAVPHASTPMWGVLVPDAPPRDALSARWNVPPGVAAPLASGNRPAVTVLLDDVRVRVPTESVCGVIGEGAVQVRVPATRHALSPGFLMVDGSRGRGRGRRTLRLYLHVAQAHLAALTWRGCLDVLESAGLRYRAKVLSDPEQYPRRDGIVVYLDSSAWPRAGSVVAGLAELPGLADDVSRLVAHLAPGVGAAWDPVDGRPGMTGLSYGEHRTAALARALVRHAVTEPGRQRDDVVAEGLVEANIDPANPARNIDSPVVTSLLTL